MNRSISRLVLMVFLGGVLGTLIRVAFTHLLHPSSNGFDLGIFAANLAGAALLGGVISVIDHRPPTRAAEFRALVGTGVCGGLTTFSTLCAGFVTLVRDRQDGVALTYLVSSVGLGFLVFAGMYVLVKFYLLHQEAN
jgi:CrcB protein